MPTNDKGQLIHFRNCEHCLSDDIGVACCCIEDDEPCDECKNTEGAIEYYTCLDCGFESDLKPDFSK